MTLRAWLTLCIGLATAVPSAAQHERRQLTLASGAIVWDGRLVGLRDESLVVQRADTSFGVPVRRITELELVRKSIEQVGAGGRGVFGALEGAGDEVYQLTLLDLRERRRIIERILLDHRAKTTSVASPAGGLIRGA